MKPVLKVFSDGEIETIGNTTRRILAKKGLRFTIPQIVDIFQRHGFETVDSNVVRINGEQLDAALRTIPRRFVRRGGQAARDVAIGDGETKFAVGSLPIWVIEESPVIRRRKASFEDLKRFTMLSESLEGFEIGNGVVQPQEIPVEVMHAVWNRNGAVRMTKPTCCWYGTSWEASEEGLEILRLAMGGMENLRAAKRWAITCCPDKALQWGPSAIGAMVFAQAEVPVEIIPVPFLGSTHPVTVAGALVQSAAEVLGLAVVTQLVRPGCPVLYAASYGGVMDMATGFHSLGSPESALMAAASAQLAHFWGIPADMMEGMCDSKLPDAQAMMEKMRICLMPALAGAECITQAGALLDFALSAAYSQLLIDEEMVKGIQRILRGSAVNATTLAEEQIMSLPFGGHYVDSQHTLDNFRSELYFPQLADRRSWDQWFADGAENMARRAGKRVQEILTKAKPALGLPDNRRKAVDGFAAEILQKHGVDPEPFLY